MPSHHNRLRGCEAPSRLPSWCLGLMKRWRRRAVPLLWTAGMQENFQMSWYCTPIRLLSWQSCTLKPLRGLRSCSALYRPQSSGHTHGPPAGRYWMASRESERWPRCSFYYCSQHAVLSALHCLYCSSGLIHPTESLPLSNYISHNALQRCFSGIKRKS